MYASKLVTVGTARTTVAEWVFEAEHAGWHDFETCASDAAIDTALRVIALADYDATSAVPSMANLPGPFEPCADTGSPACSCVGYVRRGARFNLRNSALEELSPNTVVRGPFDPPVSCLNDTVFGPRTNQSAPVLCACATLPPGTAANAPGAQLSFQYHPTEDKCGIPRSHEYQKLYLEPGHYVIQVSLVQANHWGTIRLLTRPPNDPVATSASNYSSCVVTSGCLMIGLQCINTAECRNAFIEAFETCQARADSYYCLNFWNTGAEAILLQMSSDETEIIDIVMALRGAASGEINSNLFEFWGTHQGAKDLYRCIQDCSPQRQKMQDLVVTCPANVEALVSTTDVDVPLPNFEMAQFSADLFLDVSGATVEERAASLASRGCWAGDAWCSYFTRSDGRGVADPIQVGVPVTITFTTTNAYGPGVPVVNASCTTRLLVNRAPANVHGSWTVFRDRVEQYSVSPSSGVALSPDGATLFFGFKQSVIAVDAATGAKQWATVGLPGSPRDLVVGAGALFVSTLVSASLSKFSIGGDELWRVPLSWLLADQGITNADMVAQSNYIGAVSIGAVVLSNDETKVYITVSNRYISDGSDSVDMPDIQNKIYTFATADGSYIGSAPTACRVWHLQNAVGDSQLTYICEGALFSIDQATLAPQFNVSVAMPTAAAQGPLSVRPLHLAVDTARHPTPLIATVGYDQAGCIDDDHFTDALGYGCTDWGQTQTEIAGCETYAGYTVDEMTAVRESCPRSCSMCADEMFELVLHESTDGHVIWRAELGNATYKGMSFSESLGQFFVITGGAAGLNLINIAFDSTVISAVTFPGIFPIVSRPALTADGALLYVGCSDASLKVFDTVAGQYIWSFTAGEVTQAYLGVEDVSGKMLQLRPVHTPVFGPQGSIYYMDFMHNIGAVGVGSAMQCPRNRDASVNGNRDLGPTVLTSPGPDDFSSRPAIKRASVSGGSTICNADRERSMMSFRVCRSDADLATSTCNVSADRAFEYSAGETFVTASMLNEFMELSYCVTQVTATAVYPRLPFPTNAAVPVGSIGTQLEPPLRIEAAELLASAVGEVVMDRWSVGRARTQLETHNLTLLPHWVDSTNVACGATAFSIIGVPSYPLIELSNIHVSDRSGNTSAGGANVSAQISLRSAAAPSLVCPTSAVFLDTRATPLAVVILQSRAGQAEPDRLCYEWRIADAVRFQSLAIPDAACALVVDPPLVFRAVSADDTYARAQFVATHDSGSGRWAVVMSATQIASNATSRCSVFVYGLDVTATMPADGAVVGVLGQAFDSGDLVIEVQGVSGEASVFTSDLLFRTDPAAAVPSSLTVVSTNPIYSRGLSLTSGTRIRIEGVPSAAGQLAVPLQYRAANAISDWVAVGGAPITFDVLECLDAVSCSGHGACSSGQNDRIEGAAVCLCDEGWSGDVCAEYQSAGGSESDDGSTVIVIAAACVVIGLIFTAFWLRERRRRQIKRMPHDFHDNVAALDTDGQVQDRPMVPSSLAAPGSRVTPAELKRSAVTIINVIGEGEFGEVFKGQLKPEGRSGSVRSRRAMAEYLVAIKTLKNDPSSTERQDFLREATINAQFDHDNVVSMIGVVTSGMPFLLVLELCESGALDDALRKTEYATFKLIEIALGTARGMAYLHYRCFVHRDLSARNVLLDLVLVPKVADFGLSRDIGDSSYYRATNKQGRLPLRWCSPEVLRLQKFTEASDVWSYGITCVEIFTRGAEPYDGMANSVVLEKIIAGFRIPRPDRCPEDFYNKVIARCLSKDTAERPPFEELIGAIRRVSPTDPPKVTAAAAAAVAAAAVERTLKSRPLQYINTLDPTAHAAAVDDFDGEVNHLSFKAAPATPGSIGFEMGNVRPDLGVVSNPLRAAPSNRSEPDSMMHGDGIELATSKSKIAYLEVKDSSNA